MPLLLGFFSLVDQVNYRIGRVVAWLALTMVLVQFAVVIMRYVFGTGQIWVQEAIIYQHALLFMLGASYTLLRDGHVRVDIFYARASERTKAWVNLGGSALLLIPMMLLILQVGWPYVARSWAVFEGSRETSGIPAIFLLKTVIVVFAVMLLLQALSTIVRCVVILAGGTPPPLPHEADEDADRVEV